MLYLIYFSSMHFFWQFPSPSSLHHLLEIKINLVCLCPSLAEKHSHTQPSFPDLLPPLHTQTQKISRHTAFQMNWHFKISSPSEENCSQGQNKSPSIVVMDIFCQTEDTFECFVEKNMFNPNGYKIQVTEQFTSLTNCSVWWGMWHISLSLHLWPLYKDVT